ncbi:MAG: penicillin-insensitive murein endopeptidase [Myxococcota bacterium]
MRTHVQAAAVSSLLLLLLATPRADARTHTVQDGQTLGAIAAKTRCSVRELREANDLDGDLILAGQELTIPACEGPRREGGARVVRHTVLPGENLGVIAERYGDSVAAIQKRNKLRGTTIRAGQKLKVIQRLPVRPRRKFVYSIEAGDTLGKIARRYDMSWKQIKRLNPGVDPRRLQIGQRLTLYKDGPETESKTVGRAYRGKLVNAEQLPSGPGYYRRRPRNSYGTNETISALLDAIAHVRRKFGSLHDIAVGDISDHDGGQLAGHRSHQSGRDVDLGFWFEGQDGDGPKAFISALRHELIMPANWRLLKRLVGTSEAESRVEYIFLDYGVQKKVYQWAKEHGKASEEVLRYMFQYPRGKRALRGVVRHEPGHANHYHIRFKCPDDNEDCS